LRNSNTSLDSGLEKQPLSKWAVAAIALVCFAIQAHAVDPNRKISQYMRDSWGREVGYPGGSVSAIAQTTDGYLWIGTDKGLIRFDGLNFQLFQQAIPESFPIGPVQGLTVDSASNLWILLQSTRILRFHDGKFEPGRGQAEFGITAVNKRRDGTVLFASLAFGTLTYHRGELEILSTPGGEQATSAATVSAGTNDDLSSRLSWDTSLAAHRFAEPNSAVIAMAEAADGKLWLGTQDKGLFYMSDGRVSGVGKGGPASKITCLLPLENGKLWIGTEKGVFEWNGANLTQTGVPSSLRHAKVLAMIRDHDSNIWVGTDGGLIRVNGDGVSFDTTSHGSPRPVTALYEDREGNLWVGGPRGIERLRDSAFVSYSVADGLPSESNGPVYVDPGGRTWFAPLEGGLHWLQGGHTGSVTGAGLAHDVVYSISGRGDELWVGRQKRGLTLLRRKGNLLTATTYTQAEGLAQNSIYAVHQSRDGTVWAGTLSGGVSQFRDGRFTTYTTANGLSSNTVSSIAEGPDGTMWFATPNGLNELSNGRWRVFTARDGLPSADLNCVLADSAGVLWIGSASGIAFLTSDHVQVPRQVPEQLSEQIFGIAEDKSGWLWIATSNHVLRVKRSALMGSGFSGAFTGADLRQYGLADDLLGVEGVKRHQSVFADPAGRIWFSMNRGLSFVDPSRAAGNPIPALLHVDAVFVDGSPIDPRAPMRISSARQRITFSYTGLSLSDSERIRYRYRLDGFDRDWSEPVTTRTAVYTNLSPGRYHFRVIACNSDALWNGTEAMVPFEVEPMLWQTWWFRLSALLAFGFAILTFYRSRLHRLARQYNMRMEERVGERTRIAQELHDTFLQGVLSASMQLHIAVDQVPTDSPAQPALNHVLDLMGQVVEEGRNTLQGLRSPIGSAHDLERSFSRVPQELGAQQEIGFRVIVEGSALPVRPAVRNDIYSIGREALVNAFRHSRASNIELELEYAPSRLRVLVRDNGCGIDPEVLQLGRDGHWGLSGMRERAERIGAKVKVWSRTAGGTEVELSIPGRLAFESYRSNRASDWFMKLFARDEGTSKPQKRRSV
jgi:ligand-binding sensor domain-containing protein/signal transduction histidine kinase